MPEQRKNKSRRRRLKWVLAAVGAALAALLIWIGLAPMLTADAVTAYESYTAQTGDISTVKSFSATLSVKKSETFSTTQECIVREIYVNSGDEVQKGQQLILLSTGEVFTASFSGVVNEIRVKEGDWLWPKFQLVQICDLQHLEVSMNVDEYDVEKLSLGQACTVRVISLGMDFDTVISHMNRVSQSAGNVAYYSVSCDLTVPENVLPGMQATVTIPDASVSGVTTLDMAALAFDTQKKPYVLIKQADGAYSQTYVETGLSDGMTVEITSGLNAGDTVYAKAGTQSVAAGLSLGKLYQAVFGQTVVINDLTTRSGARGESGGPPAMDGMPPTGESQGNATGDTGTGTGAPAASQRAGGSTAATQEGGNTRDN